MAELEELMRQSLECNKSEEMKLLEVLIDNLGYDINITKQTLMQQVGFPALSGTKSFRLKEVNKYNLIKK